MRRLLLVSLFTLAMTLALTVATHLRVVKIQQFCSNAMSRRVLLQPVSSENLRLAPGLYAVRELRLGNGFGFCDTPATHVVVRQGGALDWLPRMQ